MNPNQMLPPERLFIATTETELRNQLLQDELAAYVNTLIRENFEQLVQILYRIDVSESTLKKKLKDHPNEDAGKLIAAMMIERQIEKIKTRQKYK